MEVICFDLDDTLSKEIVYLQSAYREIASFAAHHCSGCQVSEIVLSQEAYEVMIHAYQSGENAFQTLNTFLGLNLPVSIYVDIYRNHFPEIHLSENAVRILSVLSDEGYVLGLITDGRSVQQRHKIEALGLDRFILNENIIISEEFGSEKPSLANFQYFMNRYPNAERFIYVGDNPQKDFIAPNRLNWLSIGLKDDGTNIHPQSSQFSLENLPKVWINDLLSLKSVLS